MSLFGAVCLLCMLGAASSANTNVLYGHDVLLMSEPRAPRLILTDDDGKLFNDLSSKAVTWCIYVNLEEKTGKVMHSVAGYASKEHSQMNEILLDVMVERKSIRVHIRDKPTFIAGMPEFNKWTFICMTWSGETGVVRVYFDGKEIGSSPNIAKGETIGKEGILVIGQDQDEYNGKYDPPAGVQGKVTQFNSFNTVLSPEEIKEVMDGKLYGNLVSWKESSWIMEGNVLILPSDTPNAALQQPPCGGGEETTPTDLSISLRFNGDDLARETFTLFYYMNKYGTNELAVVVNETRDLIAVVGTENRELPHLAVAPGWQNWNFVWSDGSLNVYGDGGLFDTLEGFTEGTQMSTEGNLYVHEVNSRKRFKVKATDYKVMERALSDGEVAAEYNMQRSETSGAKNVYYVANTGFGSDPLPYVRRYYPQSRGRSY